MRGRYPIIGLILILVIFIVGGGNFFEFKLSASQSINNFFKHLSPYSDLRIKISELERENEDLKARLFIEEVLSESSVIVYSSQPFNNRSEIALNIGSDSGVSEGDVVTQGNNILVGRVKTVRPQLSIVTTIFDPSFETAVRIGAGSVDALLRGGNQLTLDLIPPDAIIESDSIVFTAGMEFPYGLEVGRIIETRRDEGGVFRTASVEPGFEVKTLRNVVVHL
ncbi:MAG: rod shape-determining protein MreC [Patescibacteria group bacterium]